jgi:hypothetical protein
MNLQAAALTADSAVTISRMDGGGRPQHQVGVEKIFLIEEKGPIGGMVFGNGAFGGCPWPVMMQAFRETHTAPFKKIPEAVEALVEFLRNADENPRLPLSPELSRQNLFLYVLYAMARYGHCLQLEIEAEESIGQASGKKKASPYDRALALLSDEARFTWAPEGNQIARPRIGEPSPRLEELFNDYFQPMVQEAAKAVFPKSPLPDEVRDKVGELVIDTFLTDWIPPCPAVTGMVLAGFGADDLTPSYVHVDMLGCIAGVLKFQVRQQARTTTKTPIVVESFAQADPIRAFLHGADPYYEDAAKHVMRLVLEGGLSVIYDEVKKKDPALADSLRGRLVDVIIKSPSQALRYVSQLYREQLSEKMDAMLGTATDETLASHAERLLQLAILKHELTGDQSVAQPVSTLHMSKGRHTFRRP